MIKKTVTSLLVLCSSSLLFAAEVSLKEAPSWITSPPQDERCALGIGNAASDDAKAEAMLISTIEHAMFQGDDVSSSIKYYKESNGSNIVTFVSKHSANYYGMPLKEKSMWKDAAGRVYVLSCKDSESEHYDMKNFEIKQFIRTTVLKDKSTSVDRVFEVFTGDEKLILSIGTPVDGARHASVDLPGWIFNEGSADQLSSVGIAEVIKGDIQTAYVEALANARVDLGMQLSARMVEKFKALDEDSKKTDGTEAQTQDQMSKMTVEGTRMTALWLDEVNQRLYVLVQEDKTYVKNQKLWKEFKDRANEELDKEFAE